MPVRGASLLTPSRSAWPVLFFVAVVSAFAWGRCGVAEITEAETQLATAQANAQVALKFARETRYQLAQAERDLTAARAVTDRAARSGRAAMAAADAASAASRAFLNAGRGVVSGAPIADSTGRSASQNADTTSQSYYAVAPLQGACATLLAAQVAATDTLAAAFTTFIRDAMRERDATDRTLAAAHTALAASDSVVAAKDRIIAAQKVVVTQTRRQGRVRVLAALVIGIAVGVVR